MRVKTRRTCLNVSALDDRIVPSTTMDLTTRGAEASANGALFRQCDAQPTGTGVIRAFVRVQGASSGTSVEQGYNTDGRPLQFDENKSPQFTRSLTLGQVPTVNVNGVDYREFLLDINQKSSSPLLSLDELRIYVGAAGNLTGYDSTTKTLAGLSPLYDMDGAGDVTVKMNYRLNSGSGSGDVFVLIPDSAFAGQPGENFVYLYSRFGGSYAANSGFEEWAVRSTANSNPPPVQTSSLSGYVYFDTDVSGTRDASELGFEGIIMQLQGTDDLGQTVVLTVPTDANGFYQFTGLRPGTYSIFETTQPTISPTGTPLNDGNNSVGSLGGTNQEFDGVAMDGIISIVVGADQNGTDYDFGKVEYVPT